jgi:HK97 gp10 family phage protein
LSFKLNLEGYEKTIDKLRKLDNEVAQDVDEEIGKGLRKMEKTMKVLAPVNDGLLKSNIQVVQNGLLNWEIGSYAPYSAYMEFGTKKKFDSVTGYEKLAEAAKGKGSGTYKEFLRSLERWVEKKISKKNAKSIAFLIAKKIIVDGVRGNHFFTRGIEAHRPQMIKDIKNALKG